VLKALGWRPFPRRVSIQGHDYQLVQVFKHDFFAATGLMERADGHRIVLKIGRLADILGLPAGWIGRLLVRHEARIYQTLAEVSGVPAFIDFWGSGAFAHDFVPGHSLSPAERPGEAFLLDLEALIAGLHARGVAYVDLEKCSNIIVADDGRPHLIDFQISWHAPAWMGRNFPLSNLVLKLLQDMDRYHLQKHRRRTGCPTDRMFAAADPVPWYIRWHRALVKPLQKVRRAALRRLDPGRSQ
jgi:hypothetical protein